MSMTSSAAGTALRWLSVIRPADIGVLIGVASVAWLFDLGVQSGDIGLAFSASVVVAAGAVLAAGRPRNGWSRLLLGAAAVLAPWLTLRASPWLQWPDLMVAIGLLSGAAVLASAGSPFNVSFALVREWTARLARNMFRVPAFVAAPLSAAGRRLTGDRRPAVKHIGRGLAIAVPVAGVIGLLLASADPVFASFFNLQLDPATIVQHAFWLLLAGWVMAGLLRASLTAPTEERKGRLWRVNPLEAVVVLVVVDGIFVAFGAAQLITALGGGVEALHAANLTYAEYARSGFFQLLAVAVMTLPLLILLTSLSDPRTGRLRLTFTILVELAVLLTMAIVVVAHQRLSLYEAAYGYTMLRLYSHIFAFWIAIVFPLYGATLLLARLPGRWFPGAAAVAGLVLLLALNIVNPEALVVRLNVTQSNANHLLDPDYLAGLSDDAVPDLFNALARVDPRQQSVLRRQLCQRQERDGGWAGYNLSQQAARQAPGACTTALPGGAAVPNGLWAGHRWVAGPHSEAEYQEFARFLWANRITDVFFHSGPLNPDGSVPATRYPNAQALISQLQRLAPQVRVQAWLGFKHQRADDLHLGSESTRTRLVAAAGELLKVGFRGIHLDIEPASDGDPDFLRLLDGLHRRTDSDRAVLSVAAPVLAAVPGEQLVGRLINGYDHWSMTYYQQVADRVDQVAVMAYDTAMPTDWLYDALVAEETARLGDALNVRTTLFIGAPAYAERTWLHDPAAETLSASIRGVEKGMARLRPAGRSRVGLAVYAEWTSTEADWATFQHDWLTAVRNQASRPSSAAPRRSNARGRRRDRRPRARKHRPRAAPRRFRATDTASTSGRRPG